MLFILDNMQNTIGVASNSNPYSLPYYNDIHTENLEGVNTYEFQVPSDHADAKLILVEGHVIIRNLDGEHILFTIKEVADGNDSGRRIKSVFCEETAISELLSDVQRPQAFESVTLETVASSVIANTVGWTFSDIPLTDSYTVEFQDYITVLEALRQLMVTYSKEMYFTVQLNGTKIVAKHINIVDERGTKTNVRFDYSYDLKGISRTENSSNIVTALVGVGKGDNDGVRVNLVTQPAFVDGDLYKEAGADWIGSTSALQRWGKNGRHRFGVYIDDEADTPVELERRTKKELEKRITPDLHYSASVATFERLTGYEAKKTRLGDTVLINDKSFEPAIVINGRVMEVKRSYTRNDMDELDLGKYKPVTLSANTTIRDLQNIVSRSQQKWGVSSEGVLNYTWIRYADDSSGNGMSESPEGKTYIGIAPNKLSPTPSTNQIDYSWSLIKGIDGSDGQTPIKGVDYFDGVDGINGTNGVSSFLWVRYSQNADGSAMTTSPTNAKYVGVATTTTDTAPTAITAYKWSLMKGTDGIAGEDGVDGQTSYLHVKYSNDGGTTFTTNSGEDVGIYIGTYVDFNITDSTSVSAYKWNKVRGDDGYTPIKGTDYFDGVDGTDGTNGTSNYLHVRYSTTSTGTNMTTSPTGAIYIGIATTTSATAPTTASTYKWSLIKGTDGVAGENGTNGQTSYLHIKYSNDAGVTFTANSGETLGKYIGMYTDFTQADSTSVSAYTWNKIQGEDGVDGIDGTAGADGITYWTWVKYADDVVGTGMSQYPDGKRYIGLAMNKPTNIESSVATDYSWSPLYDNVRVGGVNLYRDSYLRKVVAYNSNTLMSRTLGGISSDIVKVEPVEGATGSIGFVQSSIDRRINFALDTEYTLSFDIRGTVTNLNYTYMMRNSDEGANSKFNNMTVALNDVTWTRVVMRKTAPWVTETGYILIGTTENTVGKWFEVKNVMLEAGNIDTDWSPAITDVDNKINDIDNRTQPATIISTVIYDEAFTSIMSDKVDQLDISDMATGEMLTNSEGSTKLYIDGRLDGEGGIIEEINKVSSELTKTSNAINAKFASSGGINLIKNSIGFADFDLWLKFGNMKTIQNQELEQLGFGSGFVSEKGLSGYIEQTIPITPKNPDGTPKKHSLSFWLKKTVDNATNGWAYVEIYANGVKLASVGKASGAGTTNNKWELGLYTFDTSYSEIKVRVTVGSNAEAYFSGLMLNVGEDALQWQHANGEIYNTTVQMNLNGLKVINGVTKSYTIMSDEEFSGYAEVIDEATNQPVMKRVFTLNDDTTEVTKLDVEKEIKMDSLRILQIDGNGSKGWAWVANE
ncbi:phage minor structural protein [Neobacillus niacini]|uniref:phage tail spike protein n=1 Tax=Neobacillus driksii TaxID=3035913 RepID=UPI002782FE89|nr:phage tail spike protein [Neobacillus niacini]MDQ0976608.1 phage minor structural protein [Neobacillus niacini]